MLINTVLMLNILALCCVASGFPPGDVALVRLGVKFSNDDVAPAVLASSALKISPHHAIGTLLWVCTILRPQAAPFFPMFLRDLLKPAPGALSREAVQAWINDPVEVNLQSVLDGQAVGVAGVKAAKESKGFVSFVTWLGSSAFEEWLNDDDDEDDEDEDDDEEED